MKQRDWVEVARDLGPQFAKRAAKHDAEGTFVAENYAEMKKAGLFSAAIPTELGGGGATHADVCAIVRALGRHCSSTALSYAMHSHPVLAKKHLGGKPERILRA